jgi:riboflavin transporter FmnP
MTNTAAKSRTRKTASVRWITVTAVMAAIAYVLMLIEFPVPFMPSFIKMDLSDLPALMSAFAMGPVSGIIVELIKNILHVLNSGSFGVGELSNFVLGATFVCIAGLIYRFNKTKKGAILAAVVGAIAMALISIPSNIFVVYPVYYNFMPKQTILAAYQAILPGMTSVEQSIVVFNAPFTFIKGMIDVIITFLIYKPLSPLLHGRKNM